MNITLNIQADNPGELQEAITGLAGITAGTVDSQPKSEKTKKNSRSTTKLTEQPDSKPEETVDSDKTEQPDPEPETTPETTDNESEPENIPTIVELRAKAQEKGQTVKGKEKIKALLDKYESPNITGIPENKRVAFLAELEAL